MHILAGRCEGLQADAAIQYHRKMQETGDSVYSVSIVIRGSLAEEDVKQSSSQQSDQVIQFSKRKPSIRLNSCKLLLTRMKPSLRA